jgi:hypothetical protein
MYECPKTICKRCKNKVVRYCYCRLLPYISIRLLSVNALHAISRHATPIVFCTESRIHKHCRCPYTVKDPQSRESSMSKNLSECKELRKEWCRNTEACTVFRGYDRARETRALSPILYMRYNVYKCC